MDLGLSAGIRLTEGRAFLRRRAQPSPRPRAPPSQHGKFSGEGGQKRPVAPLNNMEVSEATILVVEDNSATLAFLADNLTADGYEGLDCGSLAAAEGLLRTAFPDLAIVDLGLLDGDGLDLMHRVRSTDRTAG